MSASELWQVYDNTGQPISGYGEIAEKFAADKSLIMANSHLWLWQDADGTRQILLQTRAKHLPRKPGYLHASASGHVNVGESPKEAMIREAYEELGVSVIADKLVEQFVLLGGPFNESYNYVYTYKFDESLSVRINQAEVEETNWIPLDSFIEMTNTPEEFKLINLGEEYFEELTKVLKSV